MIINFLKSLGLLLAAIAAAVAIVAFSFWLSAEIVFWIDDAWYNLKRWWKRKRECKRA